MRQKISLNMKNDERKINDVRETYFYFYRSKLLNNNRNSKQ